MKIKKFDITKEAKFINFTTSCCTCAAGAALLIIPNIGATADKLILGIISLICGIAKLMGYFSNDLYRLAFQFNYAFGIFDILLGSFLIIFGDTALSALPMILGIYVILDGLLKQQIALDARRFGIARWRIILISGILLTAVGALLVSAATVLNGIDAKQLLPVAFIADGVENGWITMYTVKVRTVK